MVDDNVIFYATTVASCYQTISQKAKDQLSLDRFRLRFWSRLIIAAKHPGLTAMILVPDSNTMENRTPLGHNNQRQVGAGRPPTRHQVVSGVAPSKSC